MNHIWQVNIEILEQFFKMVEAIEKDMNKVLNREEREIVFLKLMDELNVKPIGATELNKEEYIKELVSKGKNILSVDETGTKVIKPKEKE